MGMRNCSGMQKYGKQQMVSFLPSSWMFFLSVFCLLGMLFFSPVGVQAREIHIGVLMVDDIRLETVKGLRDALVERLGLKLTGRTWRMADEIVDIQF